MLGLPVTCTMLLPHFPVLILLHTLPLLRSPIVVTLLRLFVRGRMLSVLLLLVLVQLPGTLLLALALVLLLSLNALLLLVVLVPLLLGVLSLALILVTRMLFYIRLLLFMLPLLLLFWRLSLLGLLPLCVRWSYDSEKKQQNSRADNSTWFHESYLHRVCFLCHFRVVKVRYLRLLWVPIFFSDQTEESQEMGGRVHLVSLRRFWRSGVPQFAGT
jgi:hypothetical protein